ncbi:hypothetical protein [Lentzea sp. NPDC003310]|uniref:hypothetical protein n=1 Tax=Lentzea sp. NPDC003310 TaxID=3154447 RepID=UPI0033B55CF7
MTPYLGLIGSVVASVAALFIAVVGWRKSDQRARQDKEDAASCGRAALLAELLELHLDAHAARHLEKNDARMKAILLRLPGHLATTLRVRLKLQHTMKDVPLDPQSAARLRPTEAHDAGHKWLIFDRSSVLTQRGFQPYPEWVEAELAYDIAGELGGDQDAVLRALSHDVRDPKDAAIAILRRENEQRNIASGNAH